MFHSDSSTLRHFDFSTFRRFLHADDPRTALTRNVSTIAAPGIPGPLALTGDNAVVVAVGGVSAGNSNLRAPVVAAARLGRGRIVAFGHTGYLDASTLDVADTAALIDNALRWSASRDADDPSDRPPLRIGLLGLDGLAAALEQRGHNTIKIVANGLPSRLPDLDVLCLSHAPLTPAQEAAVRRFISDGGGLLISGLGWGWLQLNPGKTIADHPGNRLLAPAGIAFNDGCLSRTAADGFAVGESAAESETLIPLCHAVPALDLLAAAPPKEPNNDNNRQLQQAAWTITEVIRLLPSENSPVRRRLDRLAAQNPDHLIPTPQRPIGMDQPLQRVLIAWEFDRASRLPPAKVTRAPAAARFPGDVPPDAGPVARDVEVNPRVPGWHSTGLYAPPGGLIEITVPPEAAALGWSVRIGAHIDRLWSNNPWRRSPEVSRAFPLRAERTEAANPFGGLIYLELPEPPRRTAANGGQPPPAVNGVPPPATASSPAPHIRVRISGGIEAPWFVLGRTSPDDWRRRVRGRPAPWAELQTSKIIITVPARVVRSLDDPGPLLRFWDQIADAHATLASMPLDRPRPERFVADEQISAGYMHAGYPIMTHLDVAELFVSLDRLKRGDMWGFLHELGHNHQHPDWTFDGTGEVTCNLFTLHALETICNLPPGTRGHNAVDAPPPLTDYLAGGPDFEKWKRDPFLALRMYIQMKDAFGWDVFRQVFAEYRALPVADRPRSDDEKRDQWLTRFSRAAGRNLGPFFQAWGVPTSEAARRSIADLPPWMPPDWPTQPPVSP